MSLRISVTLLEAFRLWASADWMPESDLIASIKGETVPTERMTLGSAFHRCIEKPAVCKDGAVYRSHGLYFPASVIDPMLALVNRNGTFEVKVTGRVRGHTIVAKADHLSGAQIKEFKTTTDTFDAEKYTQSYQWRFMCLLFDALAVTYHVALLKEEEDTFALRGIESIEVYPYAELRGDCQYLVAQFEDYLRVRKLSQFLEKPESGWLFGEASA